MEKKKIALTIDEESTMETKTKEHEDEHGIAVTVESRSQKIGFWVLIGFIFLLPILISPSALVNFSLSKSILISVAVLLLLLISVFEIFKNQKIRLSTNPIFIAAIAVPVVYIFAAIFSVSKESSFIGFGDTYDTVSSTLLLFLVLFLICSYIRTKKKIFYAYLAFASSFVILALFYILRIIFGAHFLSFGIFTDVTSNTIGKWNDLGVFAGMSLLLSLISLESLFLSKVFKYLLVGILTLSIILLAVINFSIVEIGGVTISIFSLIGVVALFSFVYLVSNRRKKISSTEEVKIEHFPVVSLVVFIISVILTLAINPISSFTNNVFHISQYDVRPSWQATYDVAVHSVGQKPLFGAGPNQFNYEWVIQKPAVINSTDFWNTSFDFGVGYIPSTIVTVGILGFLAWLAFLGFFIYAGVKALFSKTADPFSHYLMLSSFSVALFLWIVHILYVPSIVTLAFAFVWTGLFLASVIEAGKIKERTISLPENRAWNFVATLALVFIMLAIISWGYVIGKKAVASAYVNESSSVFNVSNMNAMTTSENYMLKALALDNQSDYHRALAQIELTKIQYLIANENSLSQQDFQAAFQQAFTNAIGQANLAKSLDPSNYQNDVMVGTISEVLVPYNTQGAYDNALAAYTVAQKLDPTDPSIDLLMAKLEIDHKNTAGAQTDIGNALKLKSNYVDAIYLLAQVQQASGDTKAATQSLEAAYSVDPNDANLVYILGQAFLSQKDYVDASAAFGRAVALAPTYSNAVYYYGLSLYLNKDNADALKQFQTLVSLNPNNKDVSAALSRLQSGGDPTIAGTNTTASAEASSTPPTATSTASSTANQ